MLSPKCSVLSADYNSSRSFRFNLNNKLHHTIYEHNGESPAHSIIPCTFMMIKEIRWRARDFLIKRTRLEKYT